jgi:hypothetical protein
MRNAIRQQTSKAQDYANELEELRMRRAQEQEERKWRLREKEQAVKQAGIRKSLGKARGRQLLEKQLRLAEQATLEKMEFQRNVAAFREQQSDIETAQQKKRDNIKLYADMLQKQIEETELLPKQREVDEIAETHEKLNAERKMLEQVKAEKMMELEKAGVPLKYRQELMTYQLLKPKIFN